MAEKPQIALVHFKKDAYVIVEGTQIADRFFIIREGNVRITKVDRVVKEDDKDVLVPGDFFGVISAMSSHSHIEIAQALTDVVLISVQKNQFEDLVQNNTPVVMKLILYFSQRMRFLNEALSQRRGKQSSPEGEEAGAALFNLGEFYAKRRMYTQAYYAYHQYSTYYPEGSSMERAKEQMEEVKPYSKVSTFEFDKTKLTRNYTKNTLIFAEGEPGDELFILQNGSVKITKIVNNDEVLLAVFKSGDIFGEMALLESKARSANAIAYEDCTVLTVNWENFQNMAKKQPQIITRLTQLLAERLWVTYKQLVNTYIPNPVARLCDALLTDLEKNRLSFQPTTNYTFDFGPKEVVAMAGIPLSESSVVIQKFLKENPWVKVVEDRIYTSDTAAILKQNTIYRNIQRHKTGA
ncbi:MAG: Crp/Fnr family transcriptional regulator [Spirochaetaceae bacterium]|jgi:CRP-like cAMP-binding protein|nr:Crp/Fnr family transcriptional regulator [Spirochaetaceae bacterium]